MREIRFRDLAPREAAQWATALDERALLVEHAARIGAHVYTLGILGLAMLAFIVSGLSSSTMLVPHALAFGFSGAGIGLLGAMALRALVFDRARFMPGRYLYRWGYAEVNLGGLRFVPGALLRHEVSIGPPCVSGASRVVVRLSSDDGWSTAFKSVGIELDVPREQLASLVSPRGDVDGGYRDAAVRAVEGRAPSRRLSSPATLALCALAAGLVAASLPVAFRWREAEKAVSKLDDEYFAYDEAAHARGAYPYFPWVVAAADAAQRRVVDGVRERLKHELRTPYREALIAESGKAHPTFYAFHECRLAPTSLFDYVRAHAAGREIAKLPAYVPVFAHPFLDHYFEYAHPFRYRNAARVRLASDCLLVPVGMLSTTPARASFEVELVWTLTESGVTTVRRSARIPAQIIEAVAACALPRRDPAEAQLRAAAMLVAATVRRDIFEPTAPAYLRAGYTDHWDELATCAEREAASITVISNPTIGS